LTSADARDRSRGGSGKTGLSGSEEPVIHTSLSRIHKSSPIYIALELDKSFVEARGGWTSLLHHP
jgi:hypothetical protein